MNKGGQEIAQKVAKVREVVNGVSTNDIILALHSYDLNVERTIQAFCEDGASAVLDDWVRPAGSGSKNKKKKNANSSQQQPNKPVKSVPAPVVEKKVAPAQPVVNNGPQKAPVVNHPEPTQSSDSNNIKDFFKVVRQALNSKEKELLNSSSSTFNADPSALVALINDLGKGLTNGTFVAVKQPVKSVSPIHTSAIKHATSQSSISSSVGADSGVNLSPVHTEPKKSNSKQVHLADGGIQMSSDGLSAEQLAAIQRAAKEQLAALGVDESMMSVVTRNDQPARKPKKPNTGRSKASKEVKASGPQLSILSA